MKLLRISMICFCLPLTLIGQDFPEFSLQQEEVARHLNFLASDEMQGRNTGTVYTDIAARYIAEEFRFYGLKSIGETYFQDVPLIKSIPRRKASLTYAESTFKLGENMLLFSNDYYNGDLDIVFAEHGWIDTIEQINDYEGLDVRGKLVIVIPGKTQDDDPTLNSEQFIFYQKFQFALQQGAKGVLLVFPFGKLDWEQLKELMMNPRIGPAGQNIPLKKSEHILGMILPDQPTFFQALKDKGGLAKAHFAQQGEISRLPISSRNVIGFIEGTDPVLKNEFIVLSAHYDHVGTQFLSLPDSTLSMTDTIYNGSRDNAMGTVALLSAAKSLAAAPPRRSVILAAFTAEEKGLFGSQYYVEQPLVPLEKTVYNLNADGVGYNDTSLVTIFGFDQVQGMNLLQQACAPFALTVADDPAPEEELFTRSDNFSFAGKGVPAPTFSVGFDAFDEEIRKYYHQVSDNPGTVNLNYLLRYSQAFTYSARLLADSDTVPFWTDSSPYLETGRALYKRKD